MALLAAGLNLSTLGAPPTPASAATVTPQVSAGTRFTCSVTSNQVARCWGYGGSGRLGNGSQISQTTPVEVTGIVANTISAGTAHACAVTGTGGVKCWGANNFGQLGNGTTTNSLVPVQVTGLTSGVVGVSAGGSHSCALLAGGGISCWGGNVAGALGDGTTTNSSVPVAAGTFGGVGPFATEVSAGYDFTCARVSTGSVSCWGKNTLGTLGNGTTTDSTSPVQVSGLTSGVSRVAAGTNQACAINIFGGAVCWGYGTTGALGQGAYTNSTVPVGVSGLASGVSDIEVGANTACAVNSAGAAKCWGDGDIGQLGNGANSDSNVPVAVSSLTSGVSDISVGGAQSCAVKSNGIFFCWGSNSDGQVGDNTTTNRNVPVKVFDLDTGLLRVTTAPAVPSQITVDGVIADTWGLQWVKQPPGNHVVCFGEVPLFSAPSCTTVGVSTGGTTSVVGQFQYRSNLRVVTSPAVPSRITVDGIARNNWGMWTDLLTGSHQVCFGAVSSYDTPPCQTVQVWTGGTALVTGIFTPSSSVVGTSYGLLRVTTSPPVPSQISVDGNPADTWGLTWLQLDPGSHQVCFRRVEGFTTPGCQTVSVSAGATTTAVGTFVPRGYLKVATSPPVAATIFVDGHAANDWGVFTDLPTGAHQVCFGPVPGKATPACTTATLTAGATTEVTGTYT